MTNEEKRKLWDVVQFEVRGSKDNGSWLTSVSVVEVASGKTLERFTMAHSGLMSADAAIEKTLVDAGWLAPR